MTKPLINGMLHGAIITKSITEAHEMRTYLQWLKVGSTYVEKE